MLKKHATTASAFLHALCGVTLFALYFFFIADVSLTHAQEGATDMITEILGNILYSIAHMLGGVIVGIGGYALDLAIQHLIVGMGAMLNGEYGTNLKQIWVVIRDLFNLLFIFSFIFLGIKTILNSDDSGTKRAIGHIIVAALFINFSLFFALAIIDFSNVIATQLYNQLIYVGISGESGQMQGSISGAFMEAASLNSLFGTESSEAKGMKVVFYAVFMLIFFVVTGIIFLFATYHVVYRFVALGLYIILSPILFLGFILPNFQKYSSNWIGGLLRQSFFAPAFLFLLYVSLQVLFTLKATLGGAPDKGFTTILEGADMSASEFTVFLFFALTIGFLYASVKVGDFMGIAGAKSTLEALNKAQMMGRRFAGNATFGLAAGIGRSSAGAIAHGISERDDLKDAASKRGFRGMLARRTLDASRVVGDASFDVRKVGGVGKTLGIGEGAKGGFKSQSEAIEKKEKAYAKELGEVGDDDNEVMFLSEKKKKLESTLTQLKLDKDNIRTKEMMDLEDARDKLKVERDEIDPNDRKAFAAKTAEINDVEKQLKAEEKKAKDKAAKDILNTEKAIKEADESIKREKNRRQIGTDVDASKAAVTRDRFNESTRELTILQGNLNNAVDKEQRNEIIEKIKKVNKERKELAREAKEAEGSLGYAGVLEKRGFWQSAPFGRFASQNHDAGKAIRKQYEKAVKKTKEEAQTDSLKESIEKSAKKD